MLGLLVLLLGCAKQPSSGSPKTVEEKLPAAEQIAAPTKIGVLLPLSGPFEQFGKLALDGISCALGTVEPCVNDFGPAELVIKDTEGNPEVAKTRTQELIEQEQIIGIIGPLLSQEFSAVASVVEPSRIPMITLAPQTIAAKPKNIFQHSLKASEEVTAIVGQTMSLGWKHFVVLYPENSYGREYSLLFKQALEKTDAALLAETAYAPDLPDFSGHLEKLLQKPAVQKILKEGKEEIAIFLPDSFRQVVMVADSLDIMDIKGVKMIGTSRWFHPKLLSHANGSLEGAIFSTPFDPEATTEAAQHFTTMFSQAFAKQPTWLEAFGFDSARILLQAARTADKAEPSAILSALTKMENFASTSGPLSWNSDQTSHWPLSFLTIKENKWQRLETIEHAREPTDPTAAATPAEEF